MKRRCPCAQIETLIGLMPGEREFTRVGTTTHIDDTTSMFEGLLGLWYCTNCGVVVFIPEEKP